MDQGPEQIVNVIRSVLTSPHSEQIMKTQMIQLARENLHLPGVIGVLLEALPKNNDQDMRRRLIGLLMTLDTSRFENIEDLYTGLLSFLKDEKERATRVQIMTRLRTALHQDPRLVPLFVDLLSQPLLSDDERAQAAAAVQSMPFIPSDVLKIALTRALSAPALVQSIVLDMAYRLPQWDNAVLEALQPYLNVKVDRPLRIRLLQKLSEGKQLTASYFPYLQTILKNDPDVSARRTALTLLTYLKGWAGDVRMQLLWTASHDADETIRAEAVRLQRSLLELSDDELLPLAVQLTLEKAAGVRAAILDLIKPRLSVPALRAAVLTSFEANPSALDEPEFQKLILGLAPFANRDPEVLASLVRAYPQLAILAQRKLILDQILPLLRPETVVTSLLGLFAKERNSEIRKILFERLRPLSVNKHPELLKVFMTELGDPISPFRQHCAEVLAAAVEDHPEIVPALEDVILHDQDRELLRTVIDGYLRPNVKRRFEVLLTIITNETINPTHRQACLDQLTKDGLTPEQSRQLADALDHVKLGVLKAT